MSNRVLIVDTDDLFRQNLAARLRKERFKVHDTGEGATMSSVLRSRNIDVVLLGLRGLGESGLTLLQQAKRLRPTTEVILLNDVDHIGLSIAGMKLGAFDDLLMPFDLAALTARIKDACQLRRAARRTRSPLRRLEQLMVAISFAEAGEHDTAHRVMKEHDRTGDTTVPGHAAEPGTAPKQRSR